jgi:hypothetical protein
MIGEFALAPIGLSLLLTLLLLGCFWQLGRVPVSAPYLPTLKAQAHAPFSRDKGHV